jgi:hypothetical protein
LHEHENPDRQAQLREAAEALVGWMYTRRAAWGDELPLESVAPPVLAAPPPELAPPAPAFRPSPPALAQPPAPVFAPHAPPLEDFSPFDFDDEPQVTEPAIAEPVVAERASAGFKPQESAAAMQSFLASLARSAAGIVPGAGAMKLVAVVAVVAVTGWMARPYIGNAGTWVTELMGKATSPKAEPVAAKPARPLGPRRTDQLIAQSEPAGATVLVDGKERGVTPLTLDDMSFGSHTVVIQSDKGSVRRTVKIAADRDAVVNESIFAGWLSVFAAFEVQIFEGGRGIRLDESGKVLLSPGPHDLRFENRDLGYRETRHVEVQPGQTTSLSLVTSPSTITVTASAPAIVVIDGQPVGETPLTNHPIALGTRDIVVRGADGTERRYTQKVTVTPVRIDVDFSKP